MLLSKKYLAIFITYFISIKKPKNLCYKIVNVCIIKSIKFFLIKILDWSAR